MCELEHPSIIPMSVGVWLVGIRCKSDRHVRPVDEIIALVMSQCIVPQKAPFGLY
jgi:hypothetical protein